MAGVDEALKRNAWIDGGRMGVTGGSYGGFMTNWIVTQTPRFRAGVAVARGSNLELLLDVSLPGSDSRGVGGFPWDNFEVLWQWSPMRFVRQVQTPVMFIHGELDNDVHITQAEDLDWTLPKYEAQDIRSTHSPAEPNRPIMTQMVQLHMRHFP